MQNTQKSEECDSFDLAGSGTFSSIKITPLVVDLESGPVD